MNNENYKNGATFKYDKKMNVEHLSVVAYKKLVVELNKCDRWNILAEHIVARLGFNGSSWIQSLKNNNVKNDTNNQNSPAENLLDQLIMRMCTVEILSDLLYDCRLLNALSIIHTTIPLIITEHPNLHKSKKQISLNSKLTLKCQATGLPPPTYIWYHENNPLDNQLDDVLNIYIDNITQEGDYRCLVQQIDCDGGLLNEIFSNSVTLTLQPTLVTIDNQPQTLVQVKEGGVLTLICNAHSYPNPKYQWYRDNTKLDLQNCNVLKIEKFSANHEGKYYCYITNGVNEVYSEKSTVIIDHPREKAVAKIALLIANESYDNHDKLNIPCKDVAKLGQLLEEIGFQVICLLNLTIVQMKNVIKVFSSFLTEGVYGLFYFAGHGFRMQECYMLAVDAPGVALRSNAICESELLAMLLPRDPALLVVILDMCQTLPSKDVNPDIHTEIPMVNEYKSKNNLRNLIQAYSTSSYRPSYERTRNEYGLYVTHLIKYITRDLPVQNVFEKTAQSIDVWFKGKERNQIPMFSSNVTKNFRLIDSIRANDPHNIKSKLERVINFPPKLIDLNFEKSNIKCQLKIIQAIKPYINWVKLSIINIDNDLKCNFYNSVSVQRTNLFRSSEKNVFYLQNPQNNKNPLVISLEKDGSILDVTVIQIVNSIPTLLLMV